MSDPFSAQPPHQPNRNLSEISHLFLSSVRDHAAEGRPRPQRTPPGQQRQSSPPPESIDLTPEEFAQVFGGPDAADEPAADRGPAPVPQVVAIIGAHLNGKQYDRAKEYARHLAAEGTRIGLIEVDASEFRVMCFDKYGDADAAESAAGVAAETSFDPRRMNEVLEEMSWDVQKWLLVLPQCRVPEARALLRESAHWALLSTCDHDGVISCYRTLKGLTDLWPADDAMRDKPSLSLALLDAPDAEQAERVSGKLASVCQQFLGWPLTTESPVCPTQRVAEHLVMCARPTRDKGQLGSAPQWEIVLDFIRRSKQSAAAPAVEPMQEIPAALSREELMSTPSNPKFQPVMKEIPMPQDELSPQQPGAAAPAAAEPLRIQPEPPVRVVRDENDVIELLAPESGESGIVDAILKHCSGELVECPISPPMCPKARLAVGRDRRIVMLAVSREGLQDLNAIGQAYKWLQENQTLIGMAVPQLAIDPQQAPHLSLLVNQSDSTAQTLQPMLQGEHVTVKTYRKLRWGGKTGLLLEAA